MSTLRRLFNLAKNTEVASWENFTTEALAAAIKLDDRPIVEALSTLGHVPAAVRVVGIQTQMHVPGGFVDLVLQLDIGGVTESVWLEVKIHAAESGEQLKHYLQLADQAQQRTRVVVLGPNALGDPEKVGQLSWQTLYRCIPPEGAHAYWTDFRHFLKEIRMADDTHEPITEVEAGSLGAARALLGKMVRILGPVCEFANSEWPGSNWPTTSNEIAKQLGSRFASLGTFTIEHRTTYRCGITMGTTNSASLSVWVWANPKHVNEREQIRRLAGKLLSDSWEYDPSSWEFLKASRQWVEGRDHAGATTWLTDRLSELKAAGVIAIIEGSGLVGDEEVDGGHP